MKLRLSIAVTTGILSGVWAWVAVTLGLIGWAGFLGCTTYFANPKKGVTGLLTGCLANLSGVAWAMLVLSLSARFADMEVLGYLLTGFISFSMCAQALKQLLFFIPGAFIGACALFAGQGDWLLVGISLCVGELFGYLMKHSGERLAERLPERPASPIPNRNAKK